MKKCIRCGTEVGDNNKFCPECGYNFNDGNINNQNQFSNKPQNNANQGTVAAVPTHQKSWFVILMLFLFFPIGIALMWIYKKEWNIVVKALITGFCAFALIGAFLDSETQPKDQYSSGNSEVVNTVDSSIIESEENIQETSTEFEKSQITTTSTETTTTQITTTVTTTKAIAESPDEFVYKGKLYSINDLNIEDAKNIFSDLTEMSESSMKNDDIGFVYDYSGNINTVFFFNDNGSFFKNINNEMSSAEVENLLGNTSVDEEGELWLLDSEGNVLYDMTAPYYIQLLEDETMGKVIMLCRTDTAMETEAKGVSKLFIGYESNDILPDLDNVTVYLDNEKMFTLQQGNVKALLYNNDGKMHTLRIENTVTHFITAEIKFRCLTVNNFYVSNEIDDGYKVSEVGEYEFVELFPNMNFTEENVYVFTENEVFSCNDYIAYNTENEIKSAIIDSIKEWF